MSPRELLRSVLPPLLLAAFATSIAFVVLGATTGLFFAGVVVATLLTPPLVLAEDTRLGQLLCAAAVVDGIGVVWLFAVADPAITFAQWLRSYLLLVSYALALWGLTALVSRLLFRTYLAGALVTTLALAWLTWPIWSSPRIAGRERLVGWLVAPHPLFALDGVFRGLGPPWSERYYMYNMLTVLNQDVAYELPRGVTAAVLFHGAAGAAGLLLARSRAVRLEVDVPDRARSAGGKDEVGEDLLPQ